MKVPVGHIKRLLYGFTFSIGFLVVFAMLVAHNTEAESSSYTSTTVKDHPLVIAVPTPDPQETISFYSKLGFRSTPDLTGGLDVVCMKREGSPYKLEICHNRFSQAGPVAGGVSALSFPVEDLAAAVKSLKERGICFRETLIKSNGGKCASLEDPNGISIRLFQR
ncbi:VOC family protein [Thermodesulfobacteriota bacterium]